MNKKGQWMSLDFLMAMILIVLSIGMLLQFMEVKSYSLKEQAMDLELQRVGETASNLLVSSPEIVCHLADNDVDKDFLGFVPNCLTFCDGTDSHVCKNEPPNDQHWGWFKNHSSSKALRKKVLGLTDDFACQITITGTTSTKTFSTDCEGNLGLSDPNNAKNVYSVKRKIILLTTMDIPNLYKAELTNCIKGESCTAFTEETLTLKVWRK